MTHHNPISLSVEDLNNIDLSAEDAHKITLSVIDWFYTQILNAIVALASVALGAEAVMSTVSKIIGAAGVGLSGTANVVSPSKVNASAGVSVGASGVAAVRSLLVAQSGAQFGAQVAARCPAIIIGSAGMGMGASAELDAGSVALWTPAQLNSSLLKLWLDANDESTITKDGSNYVSQWADKSGNGNHATQGTGNLQPVHDTTLNSLNFNYDRLEIVGKPLIQAAIFVLRNVDRGNNSANTMPIMGSAIESFGGRWYTLIGRGTSTYTTRLQLNRAGKASVNGSDLFPSGSATQNQEVTGFVPFPNRNEADCLYHEYSTQWDRGLGRICGFDDNAWNAKTDIHEALIFATTPTLEVRQRCEGYLAHKWSFTDKLPSDHPYKTSPPTV